MINAPVLTFGLPAVHYYLSLLFIKLQQDIDFETLCSKVSFSVLSPSTGPQHFCKENVDAILHDVTALSAIEKIASRSTPRHQLRVPPFSTTPFSSIFIPLSAISLWQSPSSCPSRLIYLSAAGGSRPEVCYESSPRLLRLQNKNSIGVATSVVAAQLLCGGWAAHSTSEISAPCRESTRQSRSRNSTGYRPSKCWLKFSELNGDVSVLLCQVSRLHDVWSHQNSEAI